MLTETDREELVSRGYSRRQLGRVAAALGGGALAAAFGGSAALAQSMAARGVPGAVRIGANECWTGPFPVAAAAAAEAITQGNRYDATDLRGALIATVAKVEGLPEDHILAWPGSGDPLARSVVSFCSPTRGLVTADPTFEAAWRVAAWLDTPLAKAPLTAGQGSTGRALLAANPNAGLYYVCSPNNPTGTVTPLAEIEWLVANKPTDSVVLVDEAYIHFADVPSAIRLAATRRDVIVMRTFSKLFGMAGMRLGLTFAHPDLHKRMMRYDGMQVTGTLPVTAMACGAAAYPRTDLIRERRAQMIAAREETLDHLRRRGVAFHGGSQANMFMLDWRTKDAATMQKALMDRKVQIGRSWPIWPSVSRVTVGSGAEMAAFRTALDGVLAA
jgi:histidinol-phosphate aminotransferase